MKPLQVFWRLLVTILVLGIGAAITLLLFMFAGFSNGLLAWVVGGLAATFVVFLIAQLWSQSPEVLLVGKPSGILRIAFPLGVLIFFGFIAYDLWMQFQSNS